MANRTGIHLLLIDAQVDFMDLPGSALPVPGATADMDRVAALINNQGDYIDMNHATADAHEVIDIAHKAFWVDKQGNHPADFTQITAQDVKDGIWTPISPQASDKALGGRTRLEHCIWYTEQLEAMGRYTHTVWPDHCISLSKGAAFYDPINDAFNNWSRKRRRIVNKVNKGREWVSEHFGAIEAEVQVSDAPGTFPNMGLVKTLQKARILLIAGEALSHCVKATVDQVIDRFSDEEIRKLYILTDCSSPVIHPDVDFPAIAQAWLKEVEAKGVTLVKSTDLDLSTL